MAKLNRNGGLDSPAPPRAIATLVIPLRNLEGELYKASSMIKALTRLKKISIEEAYDLAFKSADLNKVLKKEVERAVKEVVKPLKQTV
jgi:hypothetical protein